MNWDYDYIITGAGCAGLSLAMHMIQSGRFADKRILLVDQNGKKANDRTWCFWEKEEGLFEPIVFRKWNRLQFFGAQDHREMNISPYWYKMIRGIDFYDHCLSVIRQHPNFSFLARKVDHIFSSELTTGIISEGKKLHCQYVFNSIIFDRPQLAQKDYWLLQHFKGWIIHTEHQAFVPEVATLMDFRTDQCPGTAFCYVLPFSENEALVEYTVFSAELLQPEAYDAALRTYLQQNLRLENYSVKEIETGSIPMTNFRFSTGQNNITNIGTAGGQTKGSSGYTFNFIQRHSKKIINELIGTGDPFMPPRSNRFLFYDSILLNILYHKTLSGESIFSRLFSRNDPRTVLKFLDNQSSLPEELGIISTLPTAPFFRAALHQLF